MKLTHKYTRFIFTDDNNNQYDVTCKSATRGNNIFIVHKNGIYFSKYQPMGGHANKTMAKLILLKVIGNTKPSFKEGRFP